MKNYIYSLSDPDTNEVRYIGKTNNLKRRLSKHLSNSELNSGNHKSNWIISLLRNNKLPIMDIIDEFDETNDINFYEIFYISLFKTWGFNLTNQTNGGDGTFDWTGKKHKKESIHKMKMNHPLRKSVGKFDLDNNLIEVYVSIKEAARKNNCNKGHISKVCKNIPRYKTCKGFIWKYINKIEDDTINKPIIREIIKYKKPKLVNHDKKKYCIYNLKGDLLEICNSYREIEKKYSCHRVLVKKCCELKGYYQTKNLTFRYFGDNFDYFPYKYYRENRCIRINLFDKNKNFIKEFDSIKSVCEYTKTYKQYVTKNCKENINGFNKILKGYYFKYV